jgi:5'-nucleotidase / UDP-sugar diphosphatase
MSKHIRYPFFFLIILCILLISSDHSLNATTSDKRLATSDKFTLTIAHVNDTHAHIEPSKLKLTIGDQNVKVEAGGLARLVTKAKQLRADNKNFLFLHAGDLFQGTLYFKLFNGFADKYFFELAGLDAMVVGNHEFDSGIPALENFSSKAAFPLLSANMNMNTADNLRKHIKPYIIKIISGEKIGIIGLTTPDTANISLGAKNVTFQDPLATTRKYTQELKAKGVNKIILLTHLGFEEDIALATKITDVDVIVGGHSHTSLGDFTTIGLPTKNEYPYIVKDALNKDVLIIQAWNFAYLMGVLSVTFDQHGYITNYQGHPLLMIAKTDNLPTLPHVEEIAEDEQAKEKQKEFTAKLKKLRNNTVATTTEDLIRGINTGPGPIIADAMLWKTRALKVVASIINPGGTRDDLFTGPITIADAYKVLPFENTYIVLDLTGDEIIKVIEDNATVQIKKDRVLPVNVANLKYDVLMKNQAGNRIQNVLIKNEKHLYVPIDKNKTYRIVTINFLAQGGDYNHTLKNAKGYRYDTGFIETEGFIDYLRKKKDILNNTEERITIIN